MAWTPKEIERAKRILARYTVEDFDSAMADIEKTVGRDVSKAALRGLFQRQGLGAPTNYCKRAPAKAAAAPARRASSHDAKPYGVEVERLVEAMRRGPARFSELCDALDLSPTRTKKLIEEARGAGVSLHVEHDHVGIRHHVYEERVAKVGIEPVVGERQRVAVISDTHLGSKYCLRNELRDFIEYAYAQGVRDILHPGDVLDGMYKHGLWEVSHPGLEAQVQDLFETLPRKPGLTYHCITGNHDGTFAEASGVDVGEYVTNAFRKRGRDDIRFYGNRGAFLRIRGITVHLWHPRSGSSYAKSYGIQKHIEKYSSGEKPHVLLCGHWHVFCHVYERGVHGIACPTFQGGGSAFSKSLGGAPAIGGLILSWEITKHGTMRGFSLEKRSYFEDEKPREVEHHDGRRARTP
jgi:predicted phosphodiesterase